MRSYRIFQGKTKLMLHALGSTAETSHLPGTHLLAPYLTGEIGLLFTSRPPAEIESYFANYAALDYARAGATAPDVAIERNADAEFVQRNACVHEIADRAID